MLKNYAFIIVCFVAAKGPTVEPKVERIERPIAPAAVSRISGFVGTRLRANTDGYLHQFDIDRYVRMVEQKKHRDWWWIGEQPGKWPESAALAAEQSGDDALREKARKILARLVAAQEPGGYLGVTDPAAGPVFPNGVYTLRVTATSDAGYVTILEISVTVNNP